MGRLVRDGLHPDQAPDMPVGAWCDAAWSVYTDLALGIPSSEHLDALTAMWDVIVDVPAASPSEPVEPAGPGERRRPTNAERDAWGTSAAAQAGAANLAGLMNGPPPARST